MPDYPPVKEFNFLDKVRMICTWESLDGYQVHKLTLGNVIAEIGEVEIVTDSHVDDYAALHASPGSPIANSQITHVTLAIDVCDFQESTNHILVFGFDDYMEVPIADYGVFARFRIGVDNKLYIESSDEDHYERVDTGVVVPINKVGRFKIIQTPLTKFEFYRNNVLVGTLSTHIPSFVLKTFFVCLQAKNAFKKGVWLGTVIEEIAY